MLDISPTSDPVDKWLCDKCHTWIMNDKDRCSFCSNPKPNAAAVQVNPEEDKIRRALHIAIDKMRYNQMKKTWNWLEDNVL